MAIIVLVVQNKYYNFSIWLLLTAGLACLIYSAAYERYTTTIVGACSLDLHSVCLKYKDRLEYIEFSEIVFIYDGYKGKADWFYIFTFSTVKNGVNNYLIFKNDTSTKIQIMLNSKKEYQKLLDKLAELEASGIKIEKARYLFFEFKNIVKKLKCL